MAAEWIKYRACLPTHPKLLRMARIIGSSEAVGRACLAAGRGTLNESVTRDVLRDVTLASLMRVWAAASDHTVDGTWPDADLGDIDSIAGIPGFGAAMVTVGWAELGSDPPTIVFPNFLRHNTPRKNETRSAAAERMRRYRERQKDRDAHSDVTSDVTSRATGDVTRDGIESKSKSKSKTSYTKCKKSVAPAAPNCDPTRPVPSPDRDGAGSGRDVDADVESARVIANEIGNVAGQSRSGDDRSLVLKLAWRRVLGDLPEPIFKDVMDALREGLKRRGNNRIDSPYAFLTKAFGTRLREIHGEDFGGVKEGMRQWLARTKLPAPLLEKLQAPPMNGQAKAVTT